VRVEEAITICLTDLGPEGCPAHLGAAHLGAAHLVAAHLVGASRRAARRVSLPAQV